MARYLKQISVLSVFALLLSNQPIIGNGKFQRQIWKLTFKSKLSYQRPEVTNGVQIELVF